MLKPHPIKCFLLHKTKPIRNHFKYRGYLIKQFSIVALVLLATFLPVRLFFYTYVSQYWLGNLGVMTVIALTLVLLVHKNKLGWFGIYFKNRVRHLVFGRVIWLVVFFALWSIAFNAFLLIEIDKVQSGDNKDEIDFFLAILVVNQTDGTVFDDVHDLKELGLYPSNSTINEFRTGLFDGTNSTLDKINESVNEDNIIHFVDLMLAVTIYEYNEKTGAFASHFLTVFLIEEIEGLGLLVFYRIFYFKRVGVTWQTIGLPKNIKKFVRWYNKNPSKKSEVY